MNENEVLEKVVGKIEAATEDSGIGKGLSMLIGSGVTLAVMAGVYGLRKLCARLKAKKESTDTARVVTADESESEFI